MYPSERLVQRGGARHDGPDGAVFAPHVHLQSLECSLFPFRPFQVGLPSRCHPPAENRIRVGLGPPVGQGRNVFARVPEGLDELGVWESDVSVIVIQAVRHRGNINDTPELRLAAFPLREALLQLDPPYRLVGEQFQGLCL